MGVLERKFAALALAFREKDLTQAAAVAGDIRGILATLTRDVTVTNRSLDDLMQSIVELGTTKASTSDEK